MKLGKVIGNVVSTKKEGNLTGQKIMIVKYLDEKMAETTRTEACIDTVNAGSGDIVMLCASSSARATRITRHLAIDVIIVGIIDTISSGNKNLYQKSDSKEL